MAGFVAEASTGGSETGVLFFVFAFGFKFDRCDLTRFVLRATFAGGVFDSSVCVIISAFECGFIPCYSD